MANLYRINIKPGGSESYMQSFNYCLEQGVFGVGWGVGKLPEPVEWETYWETAKAEAHSRWDGKPPPQVKYIHDNIRPDDVIWTREPGGNGNYYLGRVTRPWEYRYTDEGSRLDIFNVIPCRICAVTSLTQVPGEVQASFWGQSISGTGSHATLEYTKWLWNQLSGDSAETRYVAPRFDDASVWDFLTSDQIEDVVFLYLQEQGWRVLPSSRSVNKIAFEYSLVEPGGRAAKVQVKASKGEALSPKEYEALAGEHDLDRIYLFHASGAGYECEDTDRVTALRPETLEQFMVEKAAMLPGPIAYWIDTIRRG